MNAIGKFVSCEPLENKFKVTYSMECIQCIARTFDKLHYSYIFEFTKLLLALSSLAQPFDQM